MLVVSTQHQHSSGMVSHHHGAVMLVAVSTMYHCCAFHHYHGRPPRSVRLPIIAASRDSIQSNKPTLDPDIAAQFTIQVCTSTSCTRKLNKAGLDQFHVLGEIYAQAQSVNLEKCMIIEDGGCQGGKNCKMGPCVAILHEDFEGNVALEGMNSNEFLERVFHNVLTSDDAGRVWGCVENAISLMAEEECNTK